MQDLQGTCTWSRASSSWAQCLNCPPKNLPCRWPSVMPSWWARPLMHGWTLLLSPSGLSATCVQHRLPHAQLWGLVPRLPGAHCPQTLNLIWAQWKVMGGSGSPQRRETADVQRKSETARRPVWTRTSPRSAKSSRAHKQRQGIFLHRGAAFFSAPQ